MNITRHLVGAGLLFLGCYQFATAQASPPPAQVKVTSLDEIKNQAYLDKAITELDAQLFDAYNHCDLAKFRSLVADDVEFYHDQGGLTLGGDKLTESIKTTFAPATPNASWCPAR